MTWGEGPDYDYIYDDTPGQQGMNRQELFVKR